MNRIILIAFLAFAIPQITFAAWWNPISWFVQEDGVTTKYTLQATTSVDIPSVVDEPLTQPTVESVTIPVVKEVIREVPVIKTVTVEKFVQDPTLLSQIESLKAQINTLKAQLVDANSKQCTVSGSNNTSTNTGSSGQTTNQSTSITYVQGEVYVKSPWVLDIKRHDADRVDWKYTNPNDNGRTTYRVGKDTSDFAELIINDWELGMDGTIEVVSLKNGIEIGRYIKQVITSTDGLNLK
jgi:hypothetical protein